MYKLAPYWLYADNIELFGGKLDNTTIVSYAGPGYMLSHHTHESNIEVWWKCEVCPLFPHHYHKMSIKNKLASFGKGCLNCQRLKPIKGKFSGIPESGAYWNWQLNSKQPCEISYGSKKKYQFICPFGHNFEMTCNNFTTGYRCGYCDGKKPIPGVNSFDIVEGVLEAWDWNLNKKHPCEYTPMSHTEVYFNCPEGHVYKIACKTFTTGTRCGTCIGKPWEKNNFSLVQDAMEWFDHDKNIKKITEYTMNNEQKVWFKCSKNHSFEMACSSFKAGSRCRKCSVVGVSKQANEFIRCVIKKYKLDIQYYEHPLGEFDIPGTNYSADGYVVINGVKIILEYHGRIYHGDPRYTNHDEKIRIINKTFGEKYQDTLRKEAKIRELGYELFVIWEDDYRRNRNKYLIGDFTIDVIENALKLH